MVGHVAFSSSSSSSSFSVDGEKCKILFRLVTDHTKNTNKKKQGVKKRNAFLSVWTKRKNSP
jgi:hypothetical protein